MDESQLRTSEQIEQFLSASADVAFTAHVGGDVQRYAHISRVLKRFDYPRLSKHGRHEALTVLQCKPMKSVTFFFSYFWFSSPFGGREF